MLTGQGTAHHAVSGGEKPRTANFSFGLSLSQVEMSENDTFKKEDISPRKLHIETRFGRARRLRSRKDRPCDACRHRKSACVITVRPPCRPLPPYSEKYIQPNGFNR